MAVHQLLKKCHYLWRLVQLLEICDVQVLVLAVSCRIVRSICSVLTTHMYNALLCVYLLLLLTHQQYMHRGSLRLVLNTPEQWQQYTPLMRHQILCDVAEGMAYLHSQDVYHRDLKRYNTLHMYCALLLYF
jgi:serine/threonine protein kinase